MAPSALSATLTARRIPSTLPQDILSFLLSYPTLRSNLNKKQNALFYHNMAPAKPRRSRCEDLQGELRGNWEELEYRHDFIQWFFPIREQGVNWEAQPLELHEIETIKQDEQAMARLLESYRIILSFWGLRLICPKTGLLGLSDAPSAPNPGSYLMRFRNLERNGHNWLRVTRVLKCLGEFGLTSHPPSFLLFLLTLQSAPNLSERHLTNPSVIRSMDTYWRWCIRDDEDRGCVGEVVERVRKGGVYGGEEYETWVRERAGRGEGEREGEGEVKEEGAGEGEEETQEEEKKGKKDEKRRKVA
ncbi:hypothetical protein JCM11641_002185 [Rhodosporidiobolus odoratus]